MILRDLAKISDFAKNNKDLVLEIDNLSSSLFKIEEEKNEK
jgi:hypothetical protein